MNSGQTTWERVDLPVLHFVAGCEYRAIWIFDRDEPTEEIPALTGTELDGALRRLEGYGLIRGGRAEASGYFRWHRLRPTPDGWRVLGEWPPASEADMGAALVEILRRLADDAPGRKRSRCGGRPARLDDSRDASSSTSRRVRSAERAGISRHERVDGSRRGGVALAAREPAASRGASIRA